MTRLIFVLVALLAALAAEAQRLPLSDGEGLYFSGNAPSPEHRAAGLSRAALIRPLDRDGNPHPSGRIGLISIGMSNTTQEFCAANNLGPCASWSFVGQALADPDLSPSVALINGARGGQSAGTWVSPAAANYTRIRDTILTPAGLTEGQVQVAWVKVANPNPTLALPDPNADAYRLVSQMGEIARALKTRYRNLQIAYFSSRIYAGYATGTLNPEPYAYESGLAVKWLVEAQIEQMRSGRRDARAGDLDYHTVAPWIAWGPYLWADGLNPRGDGLIWERRDLAGDGTHPSPSGQQKVGALLLAFMKSDPTARPWFVASATAPRRRAVGR